ncbi:Uncharacterized protein TCM_020441 [Theobroma cacao]|uniref:Uncharacterized protein n=1 Tax=Theobroma cacao TaxID=3641 RepID=A0A061EK68_THECC|nr:Uncharacterized protein TCM_020441 [Theobroma cacao]
MQESPLDSNNCTTNTGEENPQEPPKVYSDNCITSDVTSNITAGASCGGTGYICTTSNPMKCPSTELLNEAKTKKAILLPNNPNSGFSKIHLPPPLTTSCICNHFNPPQTPMQSPPGNANIVAEPVQRTSDSYPSPGRTEKSFNDTIVRVSRRTKGANPSNDAKREINVVCNQTV